MKIYYYHTRPILPALKEWEEHRHPGHILYGLTHFPRHGIQCVIHPYKKCSSRFYLMFYTLWSVLKCKESYDVLYGTSYRGLELIIFLRALGLYQKPIAIWHHQAIPQSKNKIKNWISKLFYKGIDSMFFFSRELIKDSLVSKKVPKNKLHLIHWGADLDFYDRLLQEEPTGEMNFISTGKEKRDLKTLLKAFSELNSQIDIYTPLSNGDTYYERVLNEYKDCKNISIHLVRGVIPYELALKVRSAKVVVIPCIDLSYTVGLTTLVEALALGIPIICTNNPKYEMNIEKEGAGFLVEYEDVIDWKRAITYLEEHPEKSKQMGLQGRRLAEQTYNLENYTSELVIVLKQLMKRK